MVQIKCNVSLPIYKVKPMTYVLQTDYEYLTQVSLWILAHTRIPPC